jgi:hypothetical protein
MWFRVFGIQDTPPAADELVEHLRGLGFHVEGHFTGDDTGWYRVDFTLDGQQNPLRLERYEAKEDDIRDELNSWAAWLETVEEHPVVPHLMHQVVSSQQVFTFECARHRIEEPGVEKFCLALCQYLAKQTRGIFQIDQRGFFAADGKLLVKE